MSFYSRQVWLDVCQLVREVEVDLAYRWFCGLGLEDSVPDHSAFPEHAMSGSANPIICV